MSPTPRHYGAAIDPMALILHGELLALYYLIHHPNEPSMKALEEVMRRATPEDRGDIAVRAKLMVEYGTAVENIVAKSTAKSAMAK